MDFCSINAGVVKKAKQLVQVDSVFSVSEGNVITPSPLIPVSDVKNKLRDVNKEFGGEVVTYNRGVYAIEPAKNVVNAYLLETKKDLIEEANEMAQFVMPETLLPAYNQNPLQSLLNIAQQGNSEFERVREVTREFHGTQMVDIALEIFPDAKITDKIEDFLFNDDPNIPLKDIANDPRFYSLKNNRDYDTLQDVVLQRMANTTGNALHRNIVSRLNNQYYITSTDKVGVNSVSSNVNRFNSFLNFNNIPTTLFDLQRFTTKSGNVGYKVKKKFFDRADVMPETKKTDKIQSIIKFLSERFGYREDQVVSITRAAFKAKFPKEYKSSMNAAVVGGNIYLLTDSNTNDITAEELLHPFINALYTANPSLFATLLAEAKKAFPLLTQQVLLNYGDQSTAIQQQEIVTKALSRTLNSEFETNPAKTLREVVSEFMSWLVENFKALFNYYNNSKYTNVNLDTLSPELTLQELAKLINTTDSRFDVQFGPTFYNQTAMSQEAYDKVYKSLSDPLLEASIGKIVLQLPDTIAEIRKTLDKTKDDRQLSTLHSLLKDIYDVQNNEEEIKVQFKTVVTVINLLDDIRKNIALVDRSGYDDNVKLMEYNGFLKTIHSLAPFQSLVTELSSIVETVKGRHPDLNLFYTLLREAGQAPRDLEDKLFKLIENPLVEELANYNAPFYKQTLDRVNADIAKLENSANDPALSLEQRERISKRISKLKSDKDRLPTKETFSKIFRSEFNDANSISLMLESGIVNGHPLVSTLMSIIEDVYYKAHQDLMASRTGYQRHIEKLAKAAGKSTNKQGEFYKPITVYIKLPTSVKEVEDADGISTGVPLLVNGKPQFEYVEQRALLNYYDGQYITDIRERDLYVSYLFNKVILAKKASQEAKSKGVQSDIDATKAKEAYFTDLHAAAAKESKEFKVANSQREYLDEVYDMYALMDEVVGQDDAGNDVTVRILTKDIYNKIEAAENDLRKNFDMESRQAAQEHINWLRSELNQLKNPLDKDGNPKTGLEAKVVEVMARYDELRFTYGDYVLTDEGQSEHDADKLILEEELAKGEITKDEYDRRLSMMMQNLIDPSYFEALESISNEISLVYNEILEIPYYKERFDTKVSEDAKEGYKVLKDMAKPYRDNDGIINGILFSSSVPELVAKIKEIQEAVQRVKEETTKMTGLSVDEKDELDELYKLFISMSTTDPTYFHVVDRMNVIKAKRADLKKNRKQNQPLFDRLDAAFALQAELVEGFNTTYYYQEKEKQKEKLKADSEDLNDVVNNIIAGGTFRPENTFVSYSKNRFGKWEKTTNDFSQIPYVPPVPEPLYDKNDPTDTGEYAVRNILLNLMVENYLKESDWWEQNHYKKSQYNKVTRKYDKVDVPLYIWQGILPKSEEYIHKDQPSRMYRKYKVKDDYVNKDYKELNSAIAAPRPGKYENEEYAKMKSSKDPVDQAYFEFLEFARANYNNSQAYYTPANKMGDILPAVVKTSGENLVNFTDNALNPEYYKAALASSAGGTDDDTSYLMGGSMSRRESIPVRFTGKMDKEKQSANIPAMLLVFELAAAVNNRMTKQLPTIQSIQNVASKIKVTESISRAKKLNFMQNIRSVFNQTAKFENVEKDVKQTNVSKTVDNFINMFVYGRNTKSSVINIGGKTVDMNKLASGVMSFASKSIFIGNIFAAVKNSVATRVQTLIQSNVQQGVYSSANFAKANGQSVEYVPQLMRDYTKIGDKSLIGMVLDYFSVMPDSLNEQFTSKTEFAWLKESMTLLSSPKAMSEFEVMLVQFLTFANNEMVQVGDTKIPLGNIDKIFEKDANGNLKFKDGVKFSDAQEASFIKLFRKYTREIAGAYRQTEQSELETYWGGKLVMFMHKYLAPGITNRYAGRRYSIEEGDFTEGYYNTSIKNVVSLFREYSMDVQAKWKDMDTMERAHFIKFCKEMAFMIGLLTLTSLMGAGDDKKELAQNAWIYNFTLAELMAIKTETETFAFAVGSGTDDLIRILRNPIIASQQIANVYKMFPLLGLTIVDSEDAYYKQNSGLHKKGDSKLLAQFFKVLGYSGKLWDGPEMVKQQQMIQTLR